ncbi:nucleotidyltransferase domain-containing protein [Halobacillus sp. B23F22_1]|uniref:nucleotidyltransferase domain-containing protein n=1 Tax=Halobacillus sp. B23F22_1 TaxID=3459514 RepID=UPI00373ECAA9
MRQHEAVNSITRSLKEDELVKSVFLKGSMGRKEEDEHSDVDLYVLVDDEDKFLPKRVRHLEAYREMIFQDDIFIIAPQIIAVYDNLLHVDLFTVTEETLIHKDYFEVLYDPHQRMEKYSKHQKLTLSDQDFVDAVDDTAFFLLQYKKSAERKNDIWSVKILNSVMENLVKVLLQKLCPERAQLGLKMAERSMNEEALHPINKVYEQLTIKGHPRAAEIIFELLDREFEWIKKVLPETKYTISFLRRMINEIRGLNKTE